MTNTQELRAVLPWYVNGTLDVDSRRGVEAQLDGSPALQAEIVWLRLLRSQIRDQFRVDIAQRSESAGLDTLLALVHGEQSGKIIPFPRRVARWVAAAHRLPLSMGLAAAVVLSQAVIIGALLDRPDPEQIRALAGGVAGGGQLLQITFKPTATEAQIRLVLAAIQGDIVGGPGALGVYSVRVADRQGPAALEKLRNDSTVIDSVALLPNR